MTRTKFGRVQLRIMQVLWQRGKANARQITDALNAEEPIAHSTVQTLLRKLEDKGSVSHDVDDRTFVYFPLIEEKNAAQSATRELIERVFSGNAAGLVAYLLEEEKIPRKELHKLRRLIDEKTPKRGA